MCPIDPKVLGVSTQHIGRWEPRPLSDKKEEAMDYVSNAESNEVVLPDEEDNPQDLEGITIMGLLKTIDNLENKIHNKWRPNSELHLRGLNRLRLLDKLLKEKLSREKF